MKKQKIIPLDVMFANDKGDVFNFTNVTLFDNEGFCCYSTSNVVWLLSKIFNKDNHIKLLKKVSVNDPLHDKNIYRTNDTLVELDNEIKELERQLEEKKHLRNNIIDENKHIKKVNLKTKDKGMIVFN